MPPTANANANNQRFAALPTSARVFLAALGDLLGEDALAIDRPAVLPGLQSVALADAVAGAAGREAVARLLAVVALRDLRAMLPVSAPVASLVGGREVRAGDDPGWGAPLWDARLWRAVTFTDTDDNTGSRGSAPIAESTLTLIAGLIAAIARAHDEGYRWPTKTVRLAAGAGEDSVDVAIPWPTETAVGALCATMEEELRAIAATSDTLPRVNEIETVVDWLCPPKDTANAGATKPSAESPSDPSRERRPRMHVEGAHARERARAAGSRGRSDSPSVDLLDWTADAPDTVASVAIDDDDNDNDGNGDYAQELSVLDLTLRHSLVTRVQRWRQRVVESLARATPRGRPTASAPPHMRLLLRLREICDRFLAGAWLVSPLSLLCVTMPMPTASTVPTERELRQALRPMLYDSDGILAAHLARAVGSAWIDHELHRVRALTAGNRESLDVRRHALSVRVGVQSAWTTVCERAGALQGLLPVASFYRLYATRVGIDDFVNRVRLEQAVYSRFSDRQMHVDAELSTFVPLAMLHERAEAARETSAMARSEQEEWLVARAEYRVDGALQMAAACAEALVLRATGRRAQRDAAAPEDDDAASGESAGSSGAADAS